MQDMVIMLIVPYIHDMPRVLHEYYWFEMNTIVSLYKFDSYFCKIQDHGPDFYQRKCHKNPCSQAVLRPR